MVSNTTHSNPLFDTTTYLFIDTSYLTDEWVYKAYMSPCQTLCTIGIND